MNEHLIIQKRTLRKKVKQSYRIYTEKQLLDISKRIFEKLESSDVFVNASAVLSFWSMPDEVFTHDFIQKWKGTKKIYLPVIHDDELIVKRFEGEKKMMKNDKINVYEPQGKKVDDLSIIDLIIVPGVAFDTNNNRLGRGKGYYDRFLPKIKDSYKIGICFPFQYFIKIPFAKNDVKMDEVITMKHEKVKKLSIMS